jgi:hypothetical protein
MGRRDGNESSRVPGRKTQQRSRARVKRRGFRRLHRRRLAILLRRTEDRCAA